jgi:excinuclease ABC subunit A
MDLIRIRGARTHNLKNVSLDLPRNRLVVLTGLSGSGKSSLAFDTLYAEGQRRYVESLSAYARQFLQLMEKPDVDLIEGLSPAIAIEQKATSHNPRSTVGTVTEIHDYLRLLFARAGTPYCPSHHEHTLEAQTVSQMVDAVLAMPEDAQADDPRAGAVGAARRARRPAGRPAVPGFMRVRIRTEAGPPGARARAPAISNWRKNRKHSIDVVVDRIKVSPAIEAAPGRIVRDGACACRAAMALAGRVPTRPRSRSSRTVSPAPSAATRCASSSRGCSRSTTRWAHAPNATAWARSSSSTRARVVQFPA